MGRNEDVSWGAVFVHRATCACLKIKVTCNEIPSEDNLFVRNQNTFCQMKAGVLRIDESRTILLKPAHYQA